VLKILFAKEKFGVSNYYLKLTEFCIDLYTIFFRLSAEVNRIVSPCTCITVLAVAVFLLLTVFQVSLVSAKQQEIHMSM